MRDKDPYLEEGRLADVLSLIQLLAFGKYAHRSEPYLEVDMQEPPKSAEGWADIAAQHREFFRVSCAEECKVSLVVRYAAYRANPDGDTSLSAEDASSLLNLAVTMYEKAVERSNRWQVVIPVISACASVLTLLAVLLTGELIGS